MSSIPDEQLEYFRLNNRTAWFSFNFVFIVAIFLTFFEKLEYLLFLFSSCFKSFFSNIAEIMLLNDSSSNLIVFRRTMQSQGSKKTVFSTTFQGTSKSTLLKKVSKRLTTFISDVKKTSNVGFPAYPCHWFSVSVSVDVHLQICYCDCISCHGQVLWLLCLLNPVGWWALGILMRMNRRARFYWTIKDHEMRLLKF